MNDLRYPSYSTGGEGPGTNQLGAELASPVLADMTPTPREPMFASLTLNGLQLRTYLTPMELTQAEVQFVARKVPHIVLVKKTTGWEVFDTWNPNPNLPEP